MKVFINGVMHDSEETPIVIVFEDDQQRMRHAQNMLNIPLRDSIRLYGVFPEGTPRHEAEGLFDKIEAATYNHNDQTNEYQTTKEDTPPL